mmetsp:Transcript_87576/g.248301  ORF Transcript_87576/g.248301 Transcript_87576/m.248301 type:complete len:222 (+) Transcript_87576:406-1071(+)
MCMTSGPKHPLRFRRQHHSCFSMLHVALQTANPSWQSYGSSASGVQPRLLCSQHHVFFSPDQPASQFECPASQSYGSDVVVPEGAVAAVRDVPVAAAIVRSRVGNSSSPPSAVEHPFCSYRQHHAVLPGDHSVSQFCRPSWQSYGLEDVLVVDAVISRAVVVVVTSLSMLSQPRFWYRQHQAVFPGDQAVLQLSSPAWQSYGLGDVVVSFALASSLHPRFS